MISQYVDCEISTAGIARSETTIYERKKYIPPDGKSIPKCAPKKRQTHHTFRDHKNLKENRQDIEQDLCRGTCTYRTETLQEAGISVRNFSAWNRRWPNELWRDLASEGVARRERQLP
jgi:hypothetical protein